MSRPSHERLGRAITQVRTRAKITQTHLSERLRGRGWPVDQSRVSKWERGVEVPPDVDLYPAIEHICGVAAGTIFRQAGYVAEDGVNVQAAIMSDPHLNQTAKLFLVDTYESAVRRFTADAKL